MKLPHHHAITVADQLLSSTQNFLLMLAIARVSSVETFGHYAIAYLVYTALILLAQSAISEPALILGGDDAPAVLPVLGAGLGLLLSPFVAAIAIASAGPSPGAIVGIFATPLVAVDCYRFAAFSCRRPLPALGIDALWVGVQLTILGALFAFGRSLSAASLLTSWGLGATVAAVVILLPRRRSIGRRELTERIVLTRPLIPRLVIETVLMNAAPYAVIGALAGVAGAVAVGSYRGAATLFGPLNTIANSLRILAVPALRKASRETLLRGSVAISTIALIPAASLATVLLVLPTHIGVHLMGATWRPAQRLVLPVGWQYVALALSIGPFVALRVRADLTRSMPTRIRASLLLLTLGTAGAALGGAKGAAFGAAAASTMSAVDWWAQCLLSTRRNGSADENEGAATRRVPEEPRIDGF